MPEQSSTIVRPRWVWGGVALLVVGVACLAAAVITLQVWVAVVGAVLLLAGLVAGARGNLPHDSAAHTSPGQVVEDVADHRSERAVDPGERVHDAEVEQHAREAESRRRAAIDTPQAGPGLAPVGIAAVLAVCGWLAVAQVFDPYSATGQQVALRDIGVAVPVALAAMVLRTRGTHVVALGLVVLGGVGLVLMALLAPHSVAWTPWSEGLSGLVLLLGAALAARRNGVVTWGR